MGEGTHHGANRTPKGNTEQDRPTHGEHRGGMHAPLERQRRDGRGHPPRSEPHNIRDTRPIHISLDSTHSPTQKTLCLLLKSNVCPPRRAARQSARRGGGQGGRGLGEPCTQTTPHVACTRYPAVGDAPQKARGRRPHKARVYRVRSRVKTERVSA